VIAMKQSRVSIQHVGIIGDAESSVGASIEKIAAIRWDFAFSTIRSAAVERLPLRSTLRNDDLRHAAIVILGAVDRSAAFSLRV